MVGTSDRRLLRALLRQAGLPRRRTRLPLVRPRRKGAAPPNPPPHLVFAVEVGRACGQVGQRDLLAGGQPGGDLGQIGADCAGRHRHRGWWRR